VSTYNYDRSVATATRLIDKYGDDAIWSKPVISQSDQPWHSSGSAPNNYDVTIVFLIPQTGIKALFAFLKGTDIPAGGERGLMAATSDFVPEISDSVTRNGKTLTIDSITVLNPGGTAILYSIEFKT
jgi:hypothetical protein